jgi:hypothetical protein
MLQLLAKPLNVTCDIRNVTTQKKRHLINPRNYKRMT